MLPIERQQRIKELIHNKCHMKISELSELLGVSEMTVHRDIKPLIDQGLIMKTYGGITFAGGRHEHTPNENTGLCIICNRPIDKRLAYRIILPNNKIETACCAHCGLIRQKQLGPDTHAMCQDFFNQTTISSNVAWFVTDTSINIGCCQPQILIFEQKDHADKFITGFGGHVYSFEEAMETIWKKINKHEPCHHHEGN